MNEQSAKAWVAALRSGEYAQTKNVLYDGQGYCCLGVLCKIEGAEFEQGGNTFYVKDEERIGHNREYTELPTFIRKRVGMHTVDGRAEKPLRVDGEKYDTLVEANDSGATFPQIADWIEANWQNL